MNRSSLSQRGLEEDPPNTRSSMCKGVGVCKLRVTPKSCQELGATKKRYETSSQVMKVQLNQAKII